MKINLKELAYMIAHKCQFCKYREKQCSEKGGCEKGIYDFLSEREQDN